MTTIAAHCLVKNEARFVWYSVMSVINHVDKILLWDTGSTDGTPEIIKEIKEYGGNKVEVKEYGEVNAETFTIARQDMLDATDSDWFIVVDGDEIWWEDSINKVVQVVESSASRKGLVESIVVPTINLVGDIFHHQEEKAGNYELAGRRGHLNLRGVNRKIPGLHSYGPHGQWGWVDKDNRMIQDRSQKGVVFVDAPYLHATHLPRANDRVNEQDVPKRAMKRKYEIGVPFPADFYYPEVFFRPRPKIVPSVWKKMDKSFSSRAILETPLRRLKRKVLPRKVGY